MPRVFSVSRWSTKKRFTISALFGIADVLLILALGAGILLNQPLPTEQESYLVWGLLVASAALFGVCASRLFCLKPLAVVVAALSVAVFVVSLSLLGGAQIEHLPSHFLRFAVFLSVAFLASLIRNLPSSPRRANRTFRRFTSKTQKGGK